MSWVGAGRAAMPLGQFSQLPGERVDRPKSPVRRGVQGVGALRELRCAGTQTVVGGEQAFRAVAGAVQPAGEFPACAVGVLEPTVESPGGAVGVLQPSG